jgi:hypothetical protein
MKKLLVLLLSAPLFTACGGGSCPDDTCNACSGTQRTLCESAIEEIEDAEGFDDLSGDQQDNSCRAAAAAICGVGG